MTDRSTALVTGANKGIGREIARGLGKLGYAVWLGCRDHARGEAAAAELSAEGLDARVLQLDVTDDDSVAAAARALGGQTDQLDALVNNAGIASGSREPPSQQPLADVKEIYETNVFGVMRTTQAFLPLLKASKAPRIVMVSSGLGSLERVSDPAWYAEVNVMGYNSSKSALNGAMMAFAKELGPLGFKVNAADPGYTATDLNNHQGPRHVSQAAVIAVQLATLPEDGPNGGFFDDEGVVPW